MSDEVVVEYKQENITPFWHKLPFFFLFPFRLGPLVFMLCLIAASALSGLLLGSMGLALKGFLAYLGLRYAFNVLELFSKGRFEGESVDYTLWGPERRPAKLGLVVVLFILIGGTLGNTLLDSRIATNRAVQEQILDRYKKDHAAEIAQRELDMEAYEKRAAANAERQAARARIASRRTTSDDGSAVSPDGDDAESYDVEADSIDETPPDAGPSREEILSRYKPAASDPLWYKLQPLWLWVLMLVLSLMLPAAAIVIALEDRFFKALNPAHVVYLTKAMGSAYFGLWGLFLLIAGARQLALSAGEHWPTAVRFPVEMGLATYLGLVLFAMIGYALYQFHQELNLHVEVDFDSHRQAGGAEAIAKAGSANAAIKAVESKDPLERKVYVLLAEGKVKEAIAEVKDLMRYDRLDPDLNNRLHPLYVLNGDQELTLAHGQQWLSGLAKAGRGKEAFDALRLLLAINPEFSVEDGDVVLPTAKAAAQKREFDIALRLAKSFDKRFPKHRDTAGVFFLCAKIASEHLRQHEKAIKILRVVLTHYPDEPVAPEVKTYLSVLEAILAKTPVPS